MTTFAEQLLALRKARGLTQRAVAALCGVSTVTVWNWEKGRATPWSADKVLATVEAAGTRTKHEGRLVPGTLLTKAEYQELNATLDKAHAARAARRLIDNIGE